MFGLVQSTQESFKMLKFLAKLIRDEAGAAAIEYGLIAALISVAAIGAFTAVGGSLTGTFNNVSSKL
jgi:pilus assembly protein Flp/PilA